MRGILDGSLRQIKRLVKPQPKHIRHSPFHSSGIEDAHGYEIKWPYNLNDVLYGRETYALETNLEFGIEDHPAPSDRPNLRQDEPDNGPWQTWAHYKATDPAPDLVCEDNDCRRCEEDGYGPHWRSPVTMPMWAARIFLKVKKVSVEKSEGQWFWVLDIERTEGK